MFQYSLAERTVSVSGKRFRRFRFPVPVRFLGHPAIQLLDVHKYACSSDAFCDDIALPDMLLATGIPAILPAIQRSAQHCLGGPF